MIVISQEIYVKSILTIPHGQNLGVKFWKKNNIKIKFFYPFIGMAIYDRAFYNEYFPDSYIPN